LAELGYGAVGHPQIIPPRVSGDPWLDPEKYIAAYPIPSYYLASIACLTASPTALLELTRVTELSPYGEIYPNVELISDTKLLDAIKLAVKLFIKELSHSLLKAFLNKLWL